MKNLLIILSLHLIFTLPFFVESYQKPSIVKECSKIERYNSKCFSTDPNNFHFYDCPMIRCIEYKNKTILKTGYRFKKL